MVTYNAFRKKQITPGHTILADIVSANTLKKKKKKKEKDEGRKIKGRKKSTHIREAFPVLRSSSPVVRRRMPCRAAASSCPRVSCSYEEEFPT